MGKLRVGCIIDDGDQPFLTYDLYCRSLKSELYSLDALIVQKPLADLVTRGKLNRATQYLKRRGLLKLIARLAFALIEQFETALVKRHPRFRRFFETFDLDTFKIPKLYVAPHISPSGSVYRYSDGDIDRIRALNLDMLIRCGTGILRGNILDVCRFGILSFHHGNNDCNRGSPPGFWEVYNQEASTGFVIQKLSSELDGGDVIFKGSIATSACYQLNQCRLYLKSSPFLHKTIERIASKGSLPKLYNQAPYAYPLYTTPTTRQTAIYALQLLLCGFKRLLRKLTRTSLRWSVAYQFARDWKSAVLWRAKVIKNPPNRFLADPFVVAHEGKNVVFVEDYDYRTSKGRIAAYGVDLSGYQELGIALEEDFHLSYPFIFRSGNDLFMCPEAHQSKDIRLYRCTDFPLRWQLHKIILKDVSAVDTSIFKYGDKYWMLTNMDSSDLGDFNSELHLFYAESFDSIEWVAHQANPVIFDSQRARNGGLILDGDEIYRVFQVQGFDMYGAKMGIARVAELSAETYREDVMCEIPPRFTDQIRGTHTFSFDSGVVVLDFVKYDYLNS